MFFVDIDEDGCFLSLFAKDMYSWILGLFKFCDGYLSCILQTLNTSLMHEKVIGVSLLLCLLVNYTIQVGVFL